MYSEPLGACQYYLTRLQSTCPRVQNHYKGLFVMLPRFFTSAWQAWLLRSLVRHILPLSLGWGLVCPSPCYAQQSSVFGGLGPQEGVLVVVNFLFVWNLLQWRPDCELLSIYTLFLLLNPLSLIFFALSFCLLHQFCCAVLLCHFSMHFVAKTASRFRWLSGLVRWLGIQSVGVRFSLHACFFVCFFAENLSF